MESYGPIWIAMNVHPWLIRRPVRECVTWALDCMEVQGNSVFGDLLLKYIWIGLNYNFLRFVLWQLYQINNGTL